MDQETKFLYFANIIFRRFAFINIIIWMHLLCKRNYTFSGTLITVQYLGWQTYTLSFRSCAYRSLIRVLGVTISSNLQMDIHINPALSTCASTMHAQRVLCSLGLPPQSLHEVAKMTTVSSLMYASPAWWGFTSAGDRKRIGPFWPGWSEVSRLKTWKPKNFLEKPRFSLLLSTVIRGTQAGW